MMPKRSHRPSRSKSMDRNRYEVAHEAARIMATEGQKNHRLAKQKAAARLGVSDRSGLPSNADVQEALQQWQALYGGDDHATHLKSLRLLALEAMELMSPFNPRLVGPVLDGTADGLSRVCLHLYTDDPDAPVHFLMQAGIDYRIERRRIRWYQKTHKDIDVLVITDQTTEVECAVMVGRDAKQAPPSPIDGQPMARASMSELQALMAS